MKKLICVLVVSLLASCAEKGETPPKALVDDLARQYWERELRTGRAIMITGGKSPLPETLYGGTRKDYQEDSVYFSQLLAQMQSIPYGELPDPSKEEYDLLKWMAEMRLEATSYYNNIFPAITPYANHLSPTDMLLKQAIFESKAELDRYVNLLEQYSEIQKQDLDKLRQMEGMSIRIPKPEIDLTLGLLKSLQVKAEGHPYFPSAGRMKNITDSVRLEFHQSIKHLLVDRILPLQDSMIGYLQGEYYKNAPETIGLGQYPGGKNYYRYLVRWHTTTDLSPEQIHAIGQKQVKAIAEKLDSIRIATGFKGDTEAFYSFLQKDKRFLATTPEEVRERLKEPLQRMEKVIQKIITLKPKAGYDVRRLPLSLEPAMTFGNYLPPSGDEKLGIYYFNGSKLDQRPLTSAASLAFHEIAPGHHWQMSIQGEHPSLSAFRKNMMITAYSEGWGDYASFLGIELGLYDDLYAYCGRLLMDMFISVRLVVDTGMNYLGWTREEAMEFMRRYVIESEEQIKTESLRYSCDIPAQALAYKIGCLRLIALREKYQKAVGADFDPRKFHDAVLSKGNLPLSVLEKSMDREFVLQ